MAIPTISTVSPTHGPSMGRALVDIVGTGFNVPVAPTYGLTDGVDVPGVEVLFDGILSPQVQILSSTELAALTPIHREGVVTVTVRNIDTDGDAIPGETVTLADAYTYHVPDLTHGSEASPTEQSSLQRILRELRQQISIQVGVDVSWTVHTDYDEETGAVLHTTKISKLPGIVLRGPDLRENRFYSKNESPEIEEGTVDTDYVTTRVPYTVDLMIEVFGFHDNTMTTFNLMSVMTTFFHMNKVITMDVDPDDSAAGKSEWEMDFQTDGEFKATHARANNSNLRSFSGAILIRGFDIEYLSGIELSGKSGSSLLPRHAATSRSRETGENETELQVGSISGEEFVS